MTAAVALAVLAGWHAAFQATVTAIVYPTLIEQPTRGFERAHERHSRRIVILVVPTYAVVLAVCAWRLLAGDLDVSTLVAVAAQGVALGSTAVLAAPTHAALGRRGPVPVLLTRLRWADGLRTVAALVGLGAALLAL